MQSETKIIDSVKIDPGTHRQLDGSWEIHDVGAAGLFKVLLKDAECVSRKVRFLPGQAIKKALGAAHLSIKRTGGCTLTNGTQVYY